MKKSKLKLLTLYLNEHNEIQFIHKKQYFNIWFSSSDYGWQINRYNINSNIIPPEPDDGGLCTGSAKDAIEFML